MMKILALLSYKGKVGEFSVFVGALPPQIPKIQSFLPLTWRVIDLNIRREYSDLI
jgi:hypothetical protein